MLATTAATADLTLFAKWPLYSHSMELAGLQAGFMTDNAASTTIYAGGATVESLKPSEAASDITSLITGVAEIIVNADYLGDATSFLPKNQAYKLIRQGTDVTATTTWARTVLTGTGTTSITTGVLSITAISTDLVVRLTATYGATVRTFDVKVIIDKAEAPSSGGGGGGGSNATTATSGLSGTVSSTTPVVIGGPLTVDTGTGGTVTLSAPFTFTTTNATPLGTFGLRAQWEEYNGSSWVALGSAVSESVGTYVYNDEGTRIVEPGSISVPYSRTGLTANTDGYQFRLVAWLPSGTRAIYPSGGCTGVGS